MLLTARCRVQPSLFGMHLGHFYDLMLTLNSQGD